VALANSNANTVSVLIGEGHGTFQTPESYATGELPLFLTAADLNGDGKPDLAVANQDNTVSVLLNQGGGKFGTAVNYPVGYFAYGIAAGDLTGNGKADLVVANYGENTVSVLLGNGNGTFQTQVQYAAGLEPSGLVLADFNGGGNLDIATANPYIADTVSVLLGNGNGTFQPVVSYPADIGPGWITTGDFNGDGKLDLAGVGFNPANSLDYVSILLGNGNGTFQPAVIYEVGSNPTGVVAGDFNHDGNLDLAVANSGSNTVSILLGNGDGTFQPQTVVSTGDYPYELSVADLNADGNLDIVTANFICGTLPCPPGTASVLFGNGDGTFQPHMDYRFSELPGGNVVEDFNGDGGVDLAVTNLYSNNVSVLLNLPVISIFPKALNFGTETVGVKSSPKTITVANPSGTPITISRPKIIGADSKDFAETTTCPLTPSTLAPGAECSINVTFDPKATGARSATLSLKDSVPGSPQSIALGGTGQSKRQGVLR
jgi:hypothetical protein